ncbi:MAG TPA: protocatechuate 3,4-dioxygenase, partial [Pyrinomonadaceae bacterium]
LALGAPLHSVFAQGQRLKESPNTVVGPFYPLIKPLDQDADLTVIAGGSGRAEGKILHLTGRVLNRGGEPVRGARVEIWQADSRGRYAHTSDRGTPTRDLKFQGFGVQTTDAEGRYRFKTIKPAPYSSEGGSLRAPHIHFDVSGRADRKVTQMFFEGEPLNDQDRIFQATLRPVWASAVGKAQPPGRGMEPDSLLVIWDVVLDHG